MLTTRQIADMLGVRRDWVIEMCRTGKLAAIQIEGRWFVKAEDFQAFKLRPRGYAQSLQSATRRAKVTA